MSHTYKKPGTYKITIQGTDSKKLVAYLSVAAIINGNPNISLNGNKPPVNKLFILWPILAVAATLVFSFWMGEQREKSILGNAHNLTPAIGTAAQTSKLNKIFQPGQWHFIDIVAKDCLIK
jgi:hypothetical protein